MSAPEEWETDHDEAVEVIVSTGNDMLDGLSDMLDEIIEAAKAEADMLRAEADAIREVSPEEAAALDEEADLIELSAVVACYELAASMAEEGSKELMDMCGNAGQVSIISNAIGDFQSICFECADQATAELA